jgi:hypothetical protein
MSNIYNGIADYHGLIHSLWLQKLVLLDTYRRLIHQLSWEKITMRIYLFIFAATYVTVQIVTLQNATHLTITGSCYQTQV